jgi:hypothetical protein
MLLGSKEGAAEVDLINGPAIKGYEKCPTRK